MFTTISDKMADENISSTERGAEVRTEGGYQYVMRKDRLGKNGERTWRCREQRKYRCSASIKTLNGQILEGQGQVIHSHVGDPILTKVREVQSVIRNKASTSHDTTRSVLAENLVGQNQDILQWLPKRTSLEDNIRSKRRAGNPIDPNPQDLGFEIPEKYQDIVLHDTGVDDPERILVLGSRELLQVLENEDVWLGDGTFAVVPTVFFQLYTIHVKVGNNYPPCVYFLLPNIMQNTYVRMLDILKTLLPSANPGVILADFENAAQNAFRLAFPNATMKGCLFHLSQSVMRKVGELGLKVNFESDPDFNMAVKSLTALSFVPENDVLERFLELVDSFPDLERVDELIAYFEVTYVQGRDRGHGRGRGPARYLPQMWNHFEDPANNVPRTTNAVEGYHNGLNSLFLSQHPSMWKLLDGLIKDIALQQKVNADNMAANNPPARQKYKVLSERLAAKVRTYPASLDKLAYLRAVAHISSSI